MSNVFIIKLGILFYFLDRMVAEISAEKKQKSQKPKNKSSSTIEDRKHLSSVRVVQRNLAYIMGMPSNLADENVCII